MNSFQPNLLSLKSPGRWHLYRLPYPRPFPLDDTECRIVRSWVESVINGAAMEYPSFHLGGVIQYNQLTYGNASMILAERAPQWGFDWGLGYWPEREPPTLWTPADFENLDVGEMPRPMMNQVFGVTQSAQAVLQSARALLGLGPVILTLSEDPVEKVKQRATALFRPLIRDISLKNFTYYFPLLAASTFAPSDGPFREEWTCGISFYLRESPEEKGIFIASRRPLDRVWQATGAVQSEPGVWTWPSEPPGKAETQD